MSENKIVQVMDFNGVAQKIQAAIDNYGDIDVICRDIESVFEDKLIEIKRLITNRSEEKKENSSRDNPEKKNDPIRSDRHEKKLLWEKNRQFFLDHEKEFEEKYPGLYIAVHDGEILDTGKHPGELTGSIYRKFGNIPVYVSKPQNQEIIETINIPIVGYWT